MPSVEFEFLSVYGSYTSTNDYKTIKKQLLTYINQNNYDYYFNGEYVIIITTNDATIQMSFFRYNKNEIIIEFNRRSGCGLTYFTIYNHLVKYLNKKIDLTFFDKKK